MSDDELTSLTLRLPTRLRERIENQARAEERTASQFVRFHLDQILAAAAGDEDGVASTDLEEGEA